LRPIGPFWPPPADDLDAHASGGAFDLGHGAVHVGGVEVRHLDRRDLADLVRVTFADGLAAGGGGALGDPGGLAEQVRGRRGLEDEGERAILEDRDLGRDHLTDLVGRLLVVGLGELDDVDAVGAEGRADRRRRRRLAGVELEREDDADLLGHGARLPF
jgi:hypothetical protein